MWVHYSDASSIHKCGRNSKSPRWGQQLGSDNKNKWWGSPRLIRGIPFPTPPPSILTCWFPEHHGCYLAKTRDFQFEVTEQDPTPDSYLSFIQVLVASLAIRRSRKRLPQLSNYMNIIKTKAMYNSYMYGITSATICSLAGWHWLMQFTFQITRVPLPHGDLSETRPAQEKDLCFLYGDTVAWYASVQLWNENTLSPNIEASGES